MGIRFNTVVFSVIACTWVPTAIFAQVELTPLAEFMELPEESRVEGYPYVRCIGLYKGVLAYGAASFSEVDILNILLNNRKMALVAFTLRVANNPKIDPEDLDLRLNVEASLLGEMYADRMNRNYLTMGQAWGSDRVIISDFETCRPIVREADEAATALMED